MFREQDAENPRLKGRNPEKEKEAGEENEACAISWYIFTRGEKKRKNSQRREGRLPGQ